jgi:hypothetical protein
MATELITGSQQIQSSQLCAKHALINAPDFNRPHSQLVDNPKLERVGLDTT